MSAPSSNFAASLKLLWEKLSLKKKEHRLMDRWIITWESKYSKMLLLSLEADVSGCSFTIFSLPFFFIIKCLEESIPGSPGVQTWPQTAVPSLAASTASNNWLEMQVAVLTWPTRQKTGRGAQLLWWCHSGTTGVSVALNYIFICWGDQQETVGHTIRSEEVKSVFKQNHPLGRCFLGC